MRQKSKSKPLSLNEIERLAEAWSSDRVLAQRMRNTLEQFGPGGSDLLTDFFWWIKNEHKALVSAHQWMDCEGTARVEYAVKFNSEEDELAFTLRFR